MIEVKGVIVRKNKKQILNQVGLQIVKGEIVGLVGPNGAGKSTLLKVIAGIEPVSEGSIHVNSEIGYVPQEIALYERLTVFDNLRFWGEISGVRLSKEQIKLVAEQVHLADHLDKKVQTLSGGMKRKLNIAAALIPDPGLLLMDEPTVGIDIKAKQEIIQLLKQLKDDGKTIVYISHDFAEIEYLCDRVVYMEDGNVRQEGIPDEIVSLFKR